MIFVEKKSRFVLVHAWQSLTAGLLSMIFQVAFLWSTLLIKLYWLSYSAFICFMLVRVILDAPSQRIYKCESSSIIPIQSIDDHHHHHVPSPSSIYIPFILTPSTLVRLLFRRRAVPLIGNWCEVRAYNRIQSATAGVNPFYRL